jgi:hypothetical protein
MRIVPVAPASAELLPARPRAISTSPAAIICAALMLALVFLAFQIAGVLRASAFSDYSSIGDSVAESRPL